MKDKKGKILKSNRKNQEKLKRKKTIKGRIGIRNLLC